MFGHAITFYSLDNEVTVLVHEVRRYETFRVMLEAESIQSMLPWEDLN
jgi:ASC-1-like (ASCH) protein